MLILFDGFLLGFSALFSVVNPFGGALVFRSLTEGYDAMARERLVQLVSIYSLIVMLVAVWAGPVVLMFFGVSLPALRIAGGLIIAIFAWRSLTEDDPEPVDDDARAATAGVPASDLAIVPLTIPITAGPGAISASIAIAAEHPIRVASEIWFLVGVSLACAAMAVVVWGFYRSADRVVGMLGATGGRTVTRLIGFLLLCIGAQIMITGVTDVLDPLLAPR